MKSVCILGSTGSIGKQALQVVADNPDLRVVGLSCGSQVEVLEEQAEAFGVVDVGVAHEGAVSRISAAFKDQARIRAGVDAASRLVREVDADLFLNAIVGVAGLSATVACLETGRPLALANKESLVSGGVFGSDLFRWAFQGKASTCTHRRHVSGCPEPPYVVHGRQDQHRRGYSHEQGIGSD